MSERNPNCKRGSEFEAVSIIVSPLKKTKLDDSLSDSHDVAFAVSSSSSVAFSAASTPSGCSVTSAGEEDVQSSSICSGCISSETNEIARNTSSTFVVDLQAHRISESENSTFITSKFREERNAVSGSLGETTETNSSLATEMDDREKAREVSKTPTTAEIEEFFSVLENDDKQKRFIEKYNFDILNDEPLQGRYKWDRLKP